MVSQRWSAGQSKGNVWDAYSKVGTKVSPTAEPVALFLLCLSYIFTKLFVLDTEALCPRNLLSGCFQLTHCVHHVQVLEVLVLSPKPLQQMALTMPSRRGQLGQPARAQRSFLTDKMWQSHCVQCIDEPQQ